MPDFARLLVALALALPILGLLLLARPWATALVRLVRPHGHGSATGGSDAGTAHGAAHRDKTNLLTQVRAALGEERERIREEEEKQRLVNLLQGRHPSRTPLLLTVGLTVVIALILGWAGSAVIHVPGH